MRSFIQTLLILIMTCLFGYVALVELQPPYNQTMLLYLAVAALIWLVLIYALWPKEGIVRSILILLGLAFLGIAYATRGINVSEVWHNPWIPGEVPVSALFVAAALAAFILASISRSNSYYSEAQQQERYVDQTREQVLKAEPHIFQGLERLNDGDVAGAIADITKAIKQAPSEGPFSSALYSYRAIAYQRRGDHQRAIYDTQRALTLDPENHTYYSMLAQSYDQLRDYNRAIANWNQAISLRSDQPLYYHGRATDYARRNRLKEALADLDYTLQLDPNNGRAYNDRAIVHQKLSEEDKAKWDARRAAALGISISEELRRYF